MFQTYKSSSLPATSAEVTAIVVKVVWHSSGTETHRWNGMEQNTKGTKYKYKHSPVELAEPLFVEAIPDVDVAVRTTCGESVVDVVESDGIDWVDLLHAVLFDPVTLERILLLLNFWAGVQVLHCHTAWIDRGKKC